MGDQDQRRGLDRRGEVCYNCLHRGRVVFVAGVGLAESVDDDTICIGLKDRGFEDRAVFRLEDIKWVTSQSFPVS